MSPCSDFMSSVEVSLALRVWSPKARGHRSTVLPAICHCGATGTLHAREEAGGACNTGGEQGLQLSIWGPL